MLLHGDPEGPTLIFNCSRENPVHQILFRVALSTGNRCFWQVSVNTPLLCRRRRRVACRCHAQRHDEEHGEADHGDGLHRDHLTILLDEGLD